MRLQLIVVHGPVLIMTLDEFDEIGFPGLHRGSRFSVLTLNIDQKEPPEAENEKRDLLLPVNTCLLNGWPLAPGIKLEPVPVSTPESNDPEALYMWLKELKTFQNKLQC